MPVKTALIIARCGWVEKLLSDLGQEFKANVSKHLYELWGVHKLYTKLYTQWLDGVVEWENLQLDIFNTRRCPDLTKCNFKKRECLPYMNLRGKNFKQVQACSREVKSKDDWRWGSIHFDNKYGCIIHHLPIRNSNTLGLNHMRSQVSPKTGMLMSE